jgi:uncharacterized protein YjdB
MNVTIGLKAGSVVRVPTSGAVAAMSSDSTVCTAILATNELTVTAVKAGKAAVTIVLSLGATATMDVTVTAA